jgi:hypothetical protein
MDCMARYSSPVSSVTTRMLCSAMCLPVVGRKNPQAAPSVLAVCSARVRVCQDAQVTRGCELACGREGKRSARAGAAFGAGKH